MKKSKRSSKVYQQAAWFDKIEIKKYSIDIMKKIKMTNEERKLMSALGRNGGKQTLEKYGREYFSELGKKAAEKRWKKSIHNPLDE